MSIEAGHWAVVVSRVTEHARKLHPRDEVARKQLINYLLGISGDKRAKSAPQSAYRRFLSFFGA